MGGRRRNSQSRPLGREEWHRGRQKTGWGSCEGGEEAGACGGRVRKQFQLSISHCFLLKLMVTTFADSEE